MRKFVRVLVPAAAGLSVIAARADGGPDISSITTAQANVAIVGAAVFAVYVAVKGFKWIRAAL